MHEQGRLAYKLPASICSVAADSPAAEGLFAVPSYLCFDHSPFPDSQGPHRRLMLLPVDAVLQTWSLAALAMLGRIARLRQVHAHLTVRRGAK